MLFSCVICTVRVDLLVEFFGRRRTIFKINAIDTIFRNFQDWNATFGVPRVVAMLPRKQITFEIFIKNQNN